MSVTTRECKYCGEPGCGKHGMCARCDRDRREAARILGRMGGRAGRGQAKARTSEQASAAGRAGALARWGGAR